MRTVQKTALPALMSVFRNEGRWDHSNARVAGGRVAYYDKRAPAGFAPIAIGLGLTLIHLIGIPVTNTSVNPARSTGVAVFVGGWAIAQLWLFWVAPIVGALLDRHGRARLIILAQAMAFGMFVVLAVMMTVYIPLQRRAARWAK